MNKLNLLKFLIPPEEREKELENFFHRYNYFIESINKDIVKLNSLITEYNSASSVERSEILIEIYHYQKEITDKYPASFNLNCPEFHKAFQIDLFNEMKHEFALLGTISLSKAAVNDFDLSKNRTPSADDNRRLQAFMHAIAHTNNPQQMYADLFYLKQRIRTLIVEEQDSERKKDLRGIVKAINAKLAELPMPRANDKDAFLEWVANMDAIKLTQLTTILLKQKALSQTDRNSLCSPDEIGRYDDYQITFLGGTRSKNFEVKSPNGSTFVLKVDNRWDAPKAMEAKLSAHALKDTITPLLVDRVAVVEQPPISGFPVTSSGLVITEYCSGGDIISYRDRVTFDDNVHLKSTIHIFKQMAEILIDMKNNNVAFPDLKNINWLIDENGNLKLADTKSFVPANEGIFNPGSDECYWYRLLHSPHVSPPELTEGKPWDVKAAHAYILGMNLYQFITGCVEESLRGKEFFFHHPIFATREGLLMQLLIENLTQADPKNRMPLERALSILTKLNQELNPNEQSTRAANPQNVDKLKQECIDLVNEIGHRYALSTNDSQMAAFINIRKLYIEIISTEAGLGILKQELEEIKKVSQVGLKMMQEIEKTITDLREGAKEFFSVGKGDKADQIEAALKKVPIERRHLIMDSKNGDEELQNALASQRHFGKLQGIFSSKTDFADTFFKTKEKIQKIKDYNENREQQSSENKRTDSGHDSRPGSKKY